MNDLNYRVKEEQIIKENNKYYNLIVFERGTKDYTESEVELGLNHIDNDMYKEYLNHLLNKYLNIKKSSKDKNEKIDILINLLYEKIKSIS